MRVEYRLEPCRSALNAVKGMPFGWSLNPYMGCVHRCTFCYVRGFERRADRPSDEGYGRSIRVKTNVAEVLRLELSRPSWEQELVAVGTATDPYQPAEGRFRLTRACLEELSRAWTPFSIITRGPLIVRDLDVLRAAAERVDVTVTVSLPTLDDRVWRTTEPGTAAPHSRLEAIRRLARAGVFVNVGLAPILPGLSDDPDSIAHVVRAAKAAGARSVWGAPLNLRAGVREHFLAALERDWPEQLDRYHELFDRRAYLPSAIANPIRESVRTAARSAPLAEGYPRTRQPLPRRPEQLALTV
jgi:DNA repair photolyase